MKHKPLFQFPLSLFALVFLLGSCGEAPKPLSMQEHYGYAYAENDNSLLYEISGNGLKTPSYLYGTIHIQRKEVFDFDTLVMQLFDTCQAYAMEVAMDEVNPMKAAKMMTLEKPLDSLISMEKFHKLDSIYEAETGSKLGMMKMTKPFFLIAQLMAEDIGGDMEMALDFYLFTKAKEAKKKTIGIEKFEEQMAAVDQLTIEEQVDIIIKSVEDSTSSMAKFDELLKMYLDGNLMDLMKMMEDPAYPEKFNKAFLHDRNIRMADRIAEISKEQMTFNAIGAAHLAGPDGVVALLRKKGFEVKPIKIQFGNKTVKSK